MNGITVFVPQADSSAVAILKRELRLSCIATKVPICTEPSARERNCFVTVRDKVDGNGGTMRLGWAVWQHENLFVEGEFHAVHDPGNSGRWIDLTPRPHSVSEILFLVDDAANYDFDSTDVIDNRRVSLTPDPRVEAALQLFTEKTQLLNSIPGIDVTADQMDPGLVLKLANCEQQAARLLEAALYSEISGDFSGIKVGRNDSCPCGSGKKYKRCHG